jgi:hypothetical protein
LCHQFHALQTRDECVDIQYEFFAKFELCVDSYTRAVTPRNGAVALPDLSGNEHHIGCKELGGQKLSYCDKSWLIRHYRAVSSVTALDLYVINKLQQLKDEAPLRDKSRYSRPSTCT